MEPHDGASFSALAAATLRARNKRLTADAAELRARAERLELDAARAREQRDRLAARLDRIADASAGRPPPPGAADTHGRSAGAGATAAAAGAGATASPLPQPRKRSRWRFATAATKAREQAEEQRQQQLLNDLEAARQTIATLRAASTDGSTDQANRIAELQTQLAEARGENEVLRSEAEEWMGEAKRRHLRGAAVTCEVACQTAALTGDVARAMLEQAQSFRFASLSSVLLLPMLAELQAALRLAAADAVTRSRLRQARRLARLRETRRDPVGMLTAAVESLDNGKRQALRKWMAAHSFISRHQTFNIGKSFGDGVLMAHLIRYYYPLLVPPGIEFPSQPRANWRILTTEVFDRIAIPVTPGMLEQLAAKQPSAVERIVFLFKSHVESFKHTDRAVAMQRAQDRVLAGESLVASIADTADDIIEEVEVEDDDEEGGGGGGGSGSGSGSSGGGGSGHGARRGRGATGAGADHEGGPGLAPLTEVANGVGIPPPLPSPTSSSVSTTLAGGGGLPAPPKHTRTASVDSDGPGGMSTGTGTGLDNLSSTGGMQSADASTNGRSSPLSDAAGGGASSTAASDPSSLSMPELLEHRRRVWEDAYESILNDLVSSPATHHGKSYSGGSGPDGEGATPPWHSIERKGLTRTGGSGGGDVGSVGSGSPPSLTAASASAGAGSAGTPGDGSISLGPSPPRSGGSRPPPNPLSSTPDVAAHAVAAEPWVWLESPPSHGGSPLDVGSGSAEAAGAHHAARGANHSRGAGGVIVSAYPSTADDDPVDDGTARGIGHGGHTESAGAFSGSATVPASPDRSLAASLTLSATAPAEASPVPGSGRRRRSTSPSERHLWPSPPQSAAATAYQNGMSRSRHLGGHGGRHDHRGANGLRGSRARAKSAAAMLASATAKAAKDKAGAREKVVDVPEGFEAVVVRRPLAQSSVPDPEREFLSYVGIHDTLLDMDTTRRDGRDAVPEARAHSRAVDAVPSHADAARLSLDEIDRRTNDCEQSMGLLLERVTSLLRRLGAATPVATATATEGGGLMF